MEDDDDLSVLARLKQNPQIAQPSLIQNRYIVNQRPSLSNYEGSWPRILQLAGRREIDAHIITLAAIMLIPLEYGIEVCALITYRRTTMHQ